MTNEEPLKEVCHKSLRTFFVETQWRIGLKWEKAAHFWPSNPVLHLECRPLVLSKKNEVEIVINLRIYGYLLMAIQILYWRLTILIDMLVHEKIDLPLPIFKYSLVTTTMRNFFLIDSHFSLFNSNYYELLRLEKTLATFLHQQQDLTES